MGIGRILVVDFDTIDDSNLSRSVLFRAKDNGRKKAEVAAETVHEINPDVAAQWLHANVNHDIGLGVYRRMDVIIGCLDNREARLTINKSCWHLNKPWIDGAIQELLGIARVFKPLKGACYECTLTDEDYKIISVRMSCNRLAHQNVIEGKVPTTPTISSIIAGVETQEALKLLHGMEVQSGKALVFNGISNDVFFMEYPEKPDCLSHEIWEDIVELPNATSEGMTVKKLLGIARRHLGPQAFLEIPSFVTNAIWKP
jgi:adenylyltransferase/sulfurtransferase